MKKSNVLAIALSAGLVLGGASDVHADGWNPTYGEKWEEASKEQDEKLAAEKEAEEAEKENLSDGLSDEWKPEGRMTI